MQPRRSIQTVRSKAFAVYLMTAPFMPHGTCFLWQPGILALHTISDVLIALAYFVIAGTLWWLISKAGGLPFKSIVASRPREFHPRPLSERCVNLSTHTAPIKQTRSSSVAPSE
jgi:hypothetical protein